MPVPSSVSDLDPVASNNSPVGSEPIGPDLDAYLRSHAAIIRQVSDASKTDVQTHAATSKDTPVDADELPIADSAASFALKKLSWANLKVAIKTYFDTLYLKLSGGNLTGPLNYVFGADMASASTVDLSLATGNSVRITGTTTINSFGTAAQNGTLRIIRFTGVLTVTHLSGGGITGDIYLPGSANITTQVGDTAIFVKNQAGIWVAASYVRADGTSIAGGLANQRMSLVASVATTSGTSVDFTSVPSWVKKITIQFLDVSTSGTSNPIVRLGSGSITATGYISSVTVPSQAAATGGAQFTTGFGFSGQSAANLAIGHMTITQQSGNTWIESTVGCFNGFSITWNGGGKVTLSDALDRIRITTVNGTDTFDGGSISLVMEGY